MKAPPTIILNIRPVSSGFVSLNIGGHPSRSLVAVSPRETRGVVPSVKAGLQSHGQLVGVCIPHLSVPGES